MAVLHATSGTNVVSPSEIQSDLRPMGHGRVGRRRLPWPLLYALGLLVLVGVSFGGGLSAGRAGALSEALALVASQPQLEGAALAGAALAGPLPTPTPEDLPPPRPAPPPPPPPPRPDPDFGGGRPPRNVIFMVSDGFGEAGLTLARTYKSRFLDAQPAPRTDGQSPAMTPLRLDGVRAGNVQTHSASSLVTDSAAGATAWSCAQKTFNEHVAVDVHEQPCGTLMEAAAKAGMATGFAVTSSVTDATPASFAAHVRLRWLHRSIALQYARQRTADLMLGGGASYFRQAALPLPWELGISYANTTAGLQAATSLPLLGIFAEHDLPWEIDREPRQVPSLRQMASRAVELLQTKAKADGNGFFLLVEGSLIDKSAHANDLGAHVHEILAYDEAVGAMLDFARDDGETLVISTSDHETGGLSLGRDPVVQQPSAAFGPEAPLRSHSLLGEAEGVVDTDYAYHPEVLRNQTASADVMARAALLVAGVVADPCGGEGDPCSSGGGTGAATTAPAVALATDSTRQAALVDALVAQLRSSEGGGLAEVRSFEVEFLGEAVQLFAAAGARYALWGEGSELYRALGAIVSARAKVGWSTFSHTAVDVPLFSYGPGSDSFRGSMDNTEIGECSKRSKCRVVSVVSVE